MTHSFILTQRIMIIKSANYLISSPEYTMCPVADRPEYAFIGRSNVGKSSLINSICNSQKLAKTSNSPGKTKLINHFEVVSARGPGDASTKWYLADLPGYGFAKVSIAQRKKWEKMIEDYIRKRENLVNIFVLIDGRHQPQKLDLEFVNQLGEWQIPFCLAFTKADKETQLMISRNVKAFLNKLRETWQFLPQHFVTSAIKNTGRENILRLINESNKEYYEAGK
ncbi:MAG: ribosome biogenesis GTP-binding protein YihA/YsxC [Chitinophagaceae bacterium]